MFGVSSDGFHPRPKAAVTSNCQSQIVLLFGGASKSRKQHLYSFMTLEAAHEERNSLISQHAPLHSGVGTRGPAVRRAKSANRADVDRHLRNRHAFLLD